MLQAGDRVTRVCIVLLPDKVSIEVLSHIERILMGYDENCVTRREGELPYHMTIIGGGKVKVGDSDVIRSVVREIKPFQSLSHIPVVCDVEPVPLFGGYIAIRLKFKEDRKYVISGSPSRNRELASMLSSNQHFDFVRHITLSKVGNDYDVMDQKLNDLGELLNIYRESLLTMTFTPMVLVRNSDSSVWKEFCV